MSHIDPELLAAWADSALSTDDAKAVESHLADCAECRAVAAAFSQTMESVVAEGRDDRRSTWILPLAATLLIGAAVAWKLWPSPAVVAPPQMAAVEPPRPVAPPPVAPANPPQYENRFATPPAKAEAPKTTKSKSADTQILEGASAPPPKPAAIMPPVPQPAPRPAPPPPIVLTPPAIAPPAAAQPPPQPVVADLRTRAEVKVTSAADGAGGGRGGRGGGAPRTVLISSTPPLRWRVTPSNVVERSVDDGVTWSAVAIEGVGAQLTAGAAPDTETCWLIGRIGAVYISKNGQPFKRLPFPEAVDLTAIVVTSDLAATVIAADGRAFVTEDGGQTWRARF